MTGADISNIVNQAAFQAARAGETEVNMGHLDYAKEKIRDGKSLIQIISLVKKKFTDLSLEYTMPGKRSRIVDHLIGGGGESSNIG